jgi:hypothetical protein
LAVGHTDGYVLYPENGSFIGPAIYLV